MSLSTADCKVGWVGHAAAKIKQVFTEARAKQPTLIFLDEIDALCPPLTTLSARSSQPSSSRKSMDS
jgi:SpoVK/Ycf46/Vps4 family AAA+-type ATPase